MTDAPNFDFDVKSILEQAAASAETVQEDSTGELSDLGHNLPWFVPVQNPAKSFPAAARGDATKDVGMFALGRKDPDTGDWAGVFFDKDLPPLLLLVDSQTLISPATDRLVGAQTTWPFDADGRRTGGGGSPLCKTTDGIAPVSFFFGRDIDNGDPRRGIPVRIGHSVKNIDWTAGKVEWEAVQATQICSVCPLGQWHERVPPLCRETYNYIAYMPPQPALRYNGEASRNQQFVEDPDWGWDENGNPIGTLVIIQGASLAVQLSLRGVKAGKSGSKATNGEPFAGIETFFRPLSKLQRTTILTNSIARGQFAMVLGFKKKKSDDITYMAEMPESDVQLIVDSDQWKYVLLEHPVYDFAPEGRPEALNNFEVPVFGIRAFKAYSNITNNPFGIDFELDDVALTPEQYAGYLLARKRYSDLNMRAQMMNTEENLSALRHTIVAAGPRLVGKLDAQQLPAGVEEGDFDEIPIDDLADDDDNRELEFDADTGDAVI